MSSLSIEPPGPWSTPSSRSESRRHTCSRSISVWTCAHATASRWSLRNASGSARTVLLELLDRLGVAGDVPELARLALVADDRHRQAPTLARLADHVLGRDARAVERHLAELLGDAVDHLAAGAARSRAGPSAPRTRRGPCAWRRRGRCGRAGSTSRRRRSSSSRSCGRRSRTRRRRGRRSCAATRGRIRRRAR